VRRADVDVLLTPTEWGILELLVRNRGKLVGHRRLLQEVWVPATAPRATTFRVYVE
jgi:two-component system KDP operon response regulator KdpE